MDNLPEPVPLGSSPRQFQARLLRMARDRQRRAQKNGHSFAEVTFFQGIKLALMLLGFGYYWNDEWDSLILVGRLPLDYSRKARAARRKERERRKAELALFEECMTEEELKKIFGDASE